ncbi:probable E3 ubiquitin-protein ligase ARI8 [Lycium barbarum]|uniref:probable E3 ubiquitin-protein ligase ARI8 n=1 Tax=Lycium barbarum TaxID=112863 RepID=UPI00293F3E43|nr:probable E3 ubiquitin-protein ligase ARI8 [Lycium barbarum]
MDSDHEIYDMYSDEDEVVFSDGDNIDESMHSDNQKNYKILKDTDIRQLVKEDVVKTSSILSVPQDVSLALLRRYNWNVTRANEEWFANEHEVRKSIGMLSENNYISVSENKNPLKRSSNHVNCGICFEEYSFDKVAFATCNKHPFCKLCWEGYISASIDDGSNKCLGLRCPEPRCDAMVGESMIVTLASEKDRLMYYDCLFRSYVEENRKIKWCPAPGCECAVEFEIGSESYDVICDCSNGFCWNCVEEIHRPIDCDTIAKWISRNHEEAANTNWILAFTKKCPKCDNSIEKNMGCMHMTCRCGYQFCWLCFEKWGTCYSKCNRYEEKKEIKEAKQCVQRYMHFYERWLSNEKSKQKAIVDLKKMRDEGLKNFSELHSLAETEFEFIIQAWKQIVKCRRVLKWTYAYGFYLPKEEVAKTRFFEYLQGEAEAGLERLHHCVEKELMDHLGSTKELDYTEQGSYKKFENFRSKVIGLIKITGNYFDKLVMALENGLKDVNTSREFTRKREAPMSSNKEGIMWKCDRCTFLNEDFDTICQMCLGQ